MQLMNRNITITENIESIRERISKTATVAGRKAEEIKLVAVTKNVGVSAIKEALRCGVSILGENRVQEAREKIEQIQGDVEWHMIGHLQRNKVKYAISQFELIHSLDSSSLAKEINRQAQKINKRVKVLIQVNISQENSKFGSSLENLVSLVKEISFYGFLELKGLMTIPPWDPEKERSRPYFSRLRKAFEAIQSTFRFPSFTELSMGMTHDFEIAIEEGATLIRLGTAIFGPRPLKE